MVNLEKREFHIIKETKLADLMLENSNLPLEMILEICNYGENRIYSIAIDCKKNKKDNLMFTSDKDLICYLVNRDILPEGDYLILVTHRE